MAYNRCLHLIPYSNYILFIRGGNISYFHLTVFAPPPEWKQQWVTDYSFVYCTIFEQVSPPSFFLSSDTCYAFQTHKVTTKVTYYSSSWDEVPSEKLELCQSLQLILCLTLLGLCLTFKEAGEEVVKRDLSVRKLQSSTQLVQSNKSQKILNWFKINYIHYLLSWNVTLVVNLPATVNISSSFLVS